MNVQDICRPVRTDLKAVEKRLLALAKAKDRFVSNEVTRVLRNGGKRLRPALLLMAAKACGHEGPGAVTMGVAIELIHTASLIHDDVIDSAGLRRGRPTVNAALGNKVSVLMGDFVYSKVFSILAEEGHLETLRAIAGTAVQMTESEMLQTLASNDTGVNEQRYLSIIAGKTASLFACACRVGATLGHTGNGEGESLAEYGQNLGMAFQIRDDLLDIVGQEKSLGKPVGNDIREGRMTLPLIHALRTAKQKDRKWLTALIGSEQIDQESFSRMGSMVAQYGGLDYSRRKIQDYGRVCKEKLSVLQESESRIALGQLVDYVLEKV